MKKLITYLSCLALSLAMGFTVSPVFAENDIPAITNPSGDTTLSFTQSGKIAKILIKEGDLVKADQLLIQQDDEAEQAQLFLIKGKSEDTTQIEAAQANLEQKNGDLKMIEWAAERSSATQQEVEHARLEAKLAELSLRAANFENQQNIGKYKEAQMRVNRMGLKSPIDGRIEMLDVEVGEAVNAFDNVVRVVKTNPLWIDVPVSMEEGNRLKLSQNAEVIFPGATRTKITGKIIFISSVADAASETLRVRIEIPNESQRPAGEHVTVTFLP